jgi:hypothetical protein
LVACDIRTDNKEGFLTGFKSEDTAPEAWAGFHAVNTMFLVTEASGVADLIFDAIEGNLQGNSRLLVVANPNRKTGYFAQSQKSPRFKKFRLNSLNAQNVVEKRNVIPGQVDYNWVKDKVETWCTEINESDRLVEKGDFEWEGKLYRPNDEFRKKVLALFPEVDEDVLIPSEWIELAFERHKQLKPNYSKGLRLGVDVAGKGRDSSSFCYRYDNYVEKLHIIRSGGTANHMQIAGITANELSQRPTIVQPIKTKAFIDTIGEGAGVYSRLEELGYDLAFSCKYSESARDEFDNDLTDITGQYNFGNMKAYLYWAVRDWLNPAHKINTALPLR